MAQVTQSFPLNQGSRGPAVQVLQVFLFGVGCNPDIIVDGIYGDETARGVIKLQREFLKLPPEFCDGNFNAYTRNMVYALRGLDFDEVFAHMQAYEAEAATP